MKILTLDELMKKSFNVVFINALKQFWQSTKSFHSIGEPKRQSLLLYLNGCKSTYKDKNGNKITAESGDIVYTPEGSEYDAYLSDFADKDSHTVGINFFLYDEDGEPIIISEGIKVFRKESLRGASIHFYEALRQGMPRGMQENRIVLIKLLTALAGHQTPEDIPDYVTAAIRYMFDNVEKNPTVKELAELSGVSEVYFRRQFKKYVSVTPSEYRSAMRLDRARTYLEYGDVSVQEISDTLGYSGVSHFIKEFRTHYGSSPLKYRKAVKKEN